VVCEHIKKLNKYIKDNKLEVSSLDLVQVACTKCKEKEELVCDK